jgi:hypothetical protein
MKLMDSIRPPAAAILLASALGAAGCGGATTTTKTTANATPTPGANAPAGRPGQGTAVVGPAAEKVKAAALAKYPGTIQDIQQLPDGSYVAGVIPSGKTAEIHVLVSKAFKVTGTRSGPPGGGPGGPPPGQNPA